MTIRAEDVIRRFTAGHMIYADVGEGVAFLIREESKRIRRFGQGPNSLPWRLWCHIRHPCNHIVRHAEASPFRAAAKSSRYVDKKG